MNSLAGLLGRLAAEGFRLELRGERIAITPKDRLTAGLEAEILRHRADVVELLRLHGEGLLNLFRDPPSWPRARGRTGPAMINWWGAIGSPVRLRDGRQGALRVVSYDTRSGRLRLTVELADGRELLDPEDLQLANPAGQGVA
jgi:hypothetical protein